MGDKFKKTVTVGYRPLPPVPEDQFCVSLNICIYSFMKYVIRAAPELTKNVYGLPALDPVRSKSREPVLSLIQVCSSNKRHSMKLSLGSPGNFLAWQLNIGKRCQT